MIASFWNYKIYCNADYFTSSHLFPIFIHILRGSIENWKKLQNALIAFRNERDWEQFHNPKDLALALSIEAAELNELFLWKKADEANLEKIKEELANVFAYAILLAEKYDLDITEIGLNKIRKNAEKYPVRQPIPIGFKSHIDMS